MSQPPVYHNPELQFDYYVIVPHTTDPRVLLLSGESGWSLPHFVPDEHHFGVVGHINQAMKNQLGIDVTALRCMRNDYDRETKHVYRVYELENHSPSWTPPDGARWVGRDTLKDLVIDVPKHRPVLEAWFAEAEEGSIPMLRRPYARTGWFDMAASWIHAQLNRLGFTATAPIEQVRTWERSCILQVSTTAGDLYFKAVRAIFGHEPMLTQVLAEQYPGHFPDVLAIDTERHWMLMRDTGGKALNKSPDVARWEAALRIFAQIQIDLVEQVDNLVVLGCPDRRLNRLSVQIAPFFAELPEHRVGLSEIEIEELRALAPKFKALCAELTSYGVPHTLDHGDFWAGQIVVSQGNYVFIDWSDSSVSHPFFSLSSLLATKEVEMFLSSIPNVRNRLRDAYLEPWTIYEPMDHLCRAFELSQALAPLQYVLTNRLIILPNIEAKWEIERMLPFDLKTLLRYKA